MLLFLTFFFLSFADVSIEPPLQDGRLLMGGDWFSEGGRLYVYNPTYEFKYECQVQLMQREGTKLHIKAANFWLSNNMVRTNGHRLNWFEATYSRGSREVSPFSGQGEFLTGDVSVALSFLKVDGEDGDQVFLSVSLSQNLTPFKVSGQNYRQFPRSQTELRASEDLFVSKERRLLETQSVEATCFKRK